MATSLGEKNYEFKPVKLGLKFDIESHPAPLKVLVYIYIYIYLCVCVCVCVLTASFL